MANPTDHLTAVRAALGLARKMTPGEYTMRRESFFVAIRAADLEELATTEQARGVDVANAAGFVALRNAAPAIAALAQAREHTEATAAAMIWPVWQHPKDEQLAMIERWKESIR